jgi:hypothetical protein
MSAPTVGVFRTNNIITVKEVFLSDLCNVEALYEKRPVTAREFAECVREGIYTQYSAIPQRFTCVEDWPTMTNLLCWSCSRGFRTYPKFVALNPERIKGRVEYEPKGNFCTWNCVVRYIRTELPENMRFDAERNTSTVSGLFESRQTIRIIPSPSKTCMKQYCGDCGVTEKQYDEMIQQLNADYTLTSYKLSQFNEYS